MALSILKRTGYTQVTTVVDGQQAMDELQRRGGADAFDIILTDLHMPRKVCLAPPSAHLKFLLQLVGLYTYELAASVRCHSCHH